MPFAARYTDHVSRGHSCLRLVRRVFLPAVFVVRLPLESSGGGDTRTESIDDLSERALAAASPEDRARCLGDIEAAFKKASSPVERGQLLICRAQVRHNQYEYRLVLDDAQAAMALFEEAGEAGLAVDAASRAAVLASRLGEQSLAADLVTKTVLGLAAVQ